MLAAGGRSTGPPERAARKRCLAVMRLMGLGAPQGMARSFFTVATAPVASAA
jgi:hypothetical protein